MAKESSFDIVSEVDFNEVRNAVNLAQKEIATRYDFKKSVSRITLEGEDARPGLRRRGKAALGRRSPRGEACAPQGAAQGAAVRQDRVGPRGQRAAERRRSTTASPTRRRARSARPLRHEFKKIKVSIQGDTVRVFCRQEGRPAGGDRRPSGSRLRHPAAVHQLSLSAAGAARAPAPAAAAAGVAARRALRLRHARVSQERSRLRPSRGDPRRRRSRSARPTTPTC